MGTVSSTLFPGAIADYAPRSGGMGKASGFPPVARPGCAVGALLAGVVADALGIGWAVGLDTDDRFGGGYSG